MRVGLWETPCCLTEAGLDALDIHGLYPASSAEASEEVEVRSLAVGEWLQGGDGS